MATVTANIAQLMRTNEAVGAEPSTFSGGDTIKVPMDGKNVVIVFKTTAGNEGAEVTGTHTVDAGNGIAGTNDLDIDVTSEENVVIQLDSSSYEQITGANTGYAVITADSTAGGEVIVLGAL